jgi:hypothetical protein
MAGHGVVTNETQGLAMPICLDPTAPRHLPRRKDPSLADTDYAAGYQTAVARFRRVLGHPASVGNERQAVQLLANGVPADEAIFHLSNAAPMA